MENDFLHNQEYNYQPQKESAHKKFFLVGGGLIVVLFFIIAMVALSRFGTTPAQDNVLPDEQVAIEEDQEPMEPEVIESEEEGKGDVATKDSDHDGVTDAEEIKNRTNPEKFDTDNDGLSDGDEKRFGTDPLRADTDGDGYLDGEELLSGYNPKGPGRLLNFDVEN